MADTAQERTEAPTPRRREEARNRGQIARSTDLTAAAVPLGALVLLHWMGGDILSGLLQVTRACLDADGAALTDPTALTLTLAQVFGVLVRIVLPLLLVVLVVALVASFAQVGVLFTLAPLTPSVDRLNPINGLSRMFSGRAVVHLLMGIAKMGVLAAVAWWTLYPRVELLLQASALPHLSMLAAGAELVYTLGLRMAIALLVLAIIDYVYQRMRTEKDLRMTKEEVKEEMKRMDGDPMIKRRRREIQMQMAIRRIKAAVPKADVVITNPTELAVAIQYDAATMNAPKVTAKGANLMAKRIRELAIEHGVPIVERKPLARALYKTVEVGQEIPGQFYKAVAEILAYVYELTGKSRKRSRAASPSMN
ncbi:MAG TPA: flagellar biosynthesis protein FlhB [Phycisphaerae bacterium]|nr:flagellar biosynthesis protein FlhB [Phycisphaerae bacterium]